MEHSGQFTWQVFWELFLIFAIFANSLSFIIYHSNVRNNSGTPNITKRLSENSNRRTYVIAGSPNQATQSVKEFLSRVPGDVILLDYSNTGYSIERFVQWMSDDIARLPPNVKPVILAISMGVLPAISVMTGTTGVELYAVNPCFGHSYLQEKMKTLCVTGAIGLTVLQIILGWISYLPIVEGIYKILGDPSPKNYSITTYAEQLCILWKTDFSPMEFESKTIRMILSYDDDVVNNSRTTAVLLEAPTTWIYVPHGTVSDSAYAPFYIEALEHHGFFD